jgi:hypothetical protein
LRCDCLAIQRIFTAICRALLCVVQPFCRGRLMYYKPQSYNTTWWLEDESETAQRHCPWDRTRAMIVILPLVNLKKDTKGKKGFSHVFPSGGVGTTCIGFKMTANQHTSAGSITATAPAYLHMPRPITVTAQPIATQSWQVWNLDNSPSACFGFGFWP